MPVSQDFIRDDGDGRGEREDDEAHGHTDAGRRRDHRSHRDTIARDQQPCVERVETANQIQVQRVEQAKKDHDWHGNRQSEPMAVT